MNTYEELKARGLIAQVTDEELRRSSILYWVRPNSG